MRARTEPPTQTTLAPALLRYARARGADHVGLLARFGLAMTVIDADDAELPPSALSELLVAVAEALGEPFLGLRLPAELPLRSYGFAEITGRSSATAGEALERLARYAPLIHPHLVATITRDAREARWVVTTPRLQRGAPRHLHEYALAYAITQLRAGGAGRTVARAWFANARPHDLAPLSAFFGTGDLSFGATDSGLALDTVALEAPMTTRDPRLLALVDPMAESALDARPGSRSFARVGAARLPSLLPDRATLEGAAEALRMSPRTLQRRMVDEGTTFSAVLEGAREELARTWLRDASLSLEAVSQRLGFSELATFSRAFKRWTGSPPGTWRRSL